MLFSQSGSGSRVLGCAIILCSETFSSKNSLRQSFLPRDQVSILTFELIVIL